MTTKNTIFKLEEGYILLEDLESWYSNGFITLEDPIQVYEDGGRRMGYYTIRNLIEIYGVEFPFRRVPRKLISAPDSPNNIPLLSSNPGITLDRLKVNYLKRLYIYVDPNELKNEESVWVKLLNSVEIPDKCPVCGNHIPKVPYRLAKHIFSEQHLTKLGEVSEEDYQFWVDILGRDSVIKSNGPLLSFPDINEELCSTEEFNRALKEMKESRGKCNDRFIKTSVDWSCEYCSFPCSLQSFTTDVKAFKHIFKISHAKRMNYTAPLEELDFWKNWLNEQMSKLNEKRSLAQKEEASVQPPVPNMKENVSETQTVEAKVDVFSKAKIPIPFPGEQGMPELPEMGGAKTSLSSKSTKRPAPGVKAQNCSSNTKFQSIPLLLSYSGPKFDRSKIDNLTKLYFEADQSILGSEDGYWARFLKTMKVPEKCPLCNNEQLSKKPFNLAKHILNEKHLSALKGIPDAEYECWVQLLSLSTVPKVELEVVQATESLATKMIVEAFPNNEGPQADKVADKNQNTLGENTPEIKKPLDAVPDAQKTGDKEVPKTPVVFQATAEKKNRPETVKNPPEPSKDATNNSKKTELVPPATGPSIVTLVSTVAQNQPRVPLLDPMLPKETSVSKEKFNNVLDECLDLYKKDRSQFDVGKKSLVTWTCTFCSTPTRKVALSNRIDTFLHIVKPEHREKMQFQASAADLNHWMGYLLEINKNTGKSLAGEQKHNAKQEVFKRPANNPRIPLLDVPASQGKLMTQDAFKSRYSNIRDQLQAINPSQETNKKLECYCYHCPGRPKFATVYSVMQHIFYGKHCENIMYSAMSSDFDYYEKLMKSMVPVPKKEPPKKTPVSIVNPIPKLSNTLIECDLPLFLTQQKMARRTDETCIGPKNSQIVYIGRLVRNPQMAPIRFKDNTICGICNVDISSWVAIKVVRHVFSTEHLHALKKTGTYFYTYDFEFWIQRLIEDNTLLYPPHFLGTTLPVVCCLGGLKYMDCNVNTSPEQRPASTAAMFKDFSFPLFVTKKDMKPRTDEVCVGPPNAYVDFVLTTKPADPGMVWPFMKENTKCKICNIFIPGTSMLDAAMHAFSVKHLYNLHQTGTNFYVTDFEWWIIRLDYEPAFVHNPTALKVIRCLGGFEIPKYDGRAKVFYCFTQEEQDIIDGIDEEMVENRSVDLLDAFGACIYCNKWLLTGMEVIKHYTSVEHFQKIREKHPVMKDLVDLMMKWVKDCQKSNRPTDYSTSSQEPLVGLAGFDYLDSYSEYENPLYLTKDKMGPRKGTVCSGPPNAHIDFLRKVKPKNESLLPKATDKWTKCGICNIPMSHWNMLQMIEHAYTVEHMYKESIFLATPINIFPFQRQITGTPLYSEDFEDTMTHLRIQLGRIGHECSSNCTTLTHLGGLRPMSPGSSAVFLEFTPEEKSMLENLDQKKVESQALSLLENFGGCIYCNQWFVSGKEVIDHFTSDSHFANIRKKEPVKRSYVTCIMEYVRRCQKDPWSCSIM